MTFANLHDADVDVKALMPIFAAIDRRNPKEARIIQEYAEERSFKYTLLEEYNIDSCAHLVEILRFAIDRSKLNLGGYVNEYYFYKYEIPNLPSPVRIIRKEDLEVFADAEVMHRDELVKIQLKSIQTNQGMPYIRNINGKPYAVFILKRHNQPYLRKQLNIVGVGISFITGDSSSFLYAHVDSLIGHKTKKECMRYTQYIPLEDNPAWTGKLNTALDWYADRRYTQDPNLVLKYGETQEENEDA